MLAKYHPIIACSKLIYFVLCFLCICKFRMYCMLEKCLNNRREIFLNSTIMNTERGVAFRSSLYETNIVIVRNKSIAESPAPPAVLKGSSYNQ